MKKRIVISLGGSLIIPKQIDNNFLKEFRKTIRKNYKKYKFIIVCGGGVIARKYISALKETGKNEREIALAGIMATRMNANLMTQMFGKDETNDKIPRSMKQVKNALRKNNVVFCGALRYSKKETSDGTAAKLAKYFKTEFINLTNVPGLFTKDPNKYKNTKLISKISWKELEEKTSKFQYKAGQHFVIDQSASRIIRKHRIKTYIIGKNLKNLDNLLNNRKFKGTRVENDNNR